MNNKISNLENALTKQREELNSESKKNMAQIEQIKKTMSDREND